MPLIVIDKDAVFDCLPVIENAVIILHRNKSMRFILTPHFYLQLKRIVSVSHKKGPRTNGGRV